MTRPTTFPDTLRWTAEYIGEADGLMIDILRQLGHLTDDDEAFFAGTACQDDLLTMAGLIEASPAISSALDKLWRSAPHTRRAP